MKLKSAVLITVLISQCVGLSISFADNKNREVTPVKVTTIEKRSLKETLELNGEILGYSEVTVYSKVSGTIEKLLVEKGDTVKKGDTIAIVEHKSDLKKLELMKIAKDLAQIAISQSEASLNIAKAGLKQAEATMTQALSSVKIAQSGIVQSEAQYNQAKTSIAAAEAGLARADAQLENAKLEKDRAENLLKEGAIPKQRYEGIIAQFKAAKAGRDSAIEKLLKGETTLAEINRVTFVDKAGGGS